MLFNLETERLLIASMITKPAVYAKVAHLPDSVFHDGHNREWFNAIRDCYSEAGECDLVAVQSKLAKVGNSQIFSERFQTIAEAPIVPTSFDYHISTLLDCHHLRILTLAGNDVQKSNEVEEAREILNKALLETVAGLSDSGQSVKELAEDDSNLSSAVDTLQTGFGGIDNTIKGFALKELVVIGGHAKHGKTTLALQLAFEMSKKRRVNFYSLEMSRRELYQKIMSRKSRVFMDRVSSGIYSQTEKARIADAKETFLKGVYNFHIVDGMCHIDEILAHAKLSILSDDMKIMVVDYVQLCETAEGKNKSRYEYVGQVTRRLKQFAMKENVLVIALSQLNGSEVDRPTISSFRESGNIGQDCNIPIFVWYDQKDMQMKIIIERSRRASAKDIPVTLRGEVCNFEDNSNIQPTSWNEMGES